MISPPGLLLLALPPLFFAAAAAAEPPQAVLTHRSQTGTGSGTPPRPISAPGDRELQHDGQHQRASKGGYISASALSASMMRREVLPHDHQEGAAPSLAEGASASAVFSPRRRVTSTNVVDLDGQWVTSDGTERDISGSMVTGAGDYRLFLSIKQGGRRLEMTQNGKNYWASLSGMGSFNWNDGEVWKRKVDCKFSDWTDFGACGGPCKATEQQRQREYTFLQENDGEACIGPILQCQESTYCGADIQVNASNDTSGASSADVGHGDGDSSDAEFGSSGDAHGDDHGSSGDAHGDEDAHAHLQTSSSEGEFVQENNGSDAAGNESGNSSNKSAAVRVFGGGRWPLLMGALLVPALALSRGAA